jgi:hypothetical protein
VEKTSWKSQNCQYPSLIIPWILNLNPQVNFLQLHTITWPNVLQWWRRHASLCIFPSCYNIMQMYPIYKIAEENKPHKATEKTSCKSQNCQYPSLIMEFPIPWFSFSYTQWRRHASLVFSPTATTQCRCISMRL